MSTRRHRSGQTLIEMCAAMALMGIVCYTFASISEIVMTVFRNAFIQNSVSTQVEPVRSLLADQVRQCRFAVYSTVTAAEINDTTKIVATATTGNKLSSQFALRCTRRDGQGVFILAWETVTGEPGLYIITGKAIGTNAGNTYNTDIPICKSFCFFEFDDSQGFLQTTFSIPAPGNGGYDDTQALITRSAKVNNIPAITYNIVTESAL
jgi:hypothetical protein